MCTDPIQQWQHIGRTTKGIFWQLIQLVSIMFLSYIYTSSILGFVLKHLKLPAARLYVDALKSSLGSRRAVFSAVCYQDKSVHFTHEALILSDIFIYVTTVCWI